MYWVRGGEIEIELQAFGWGNAAGPAGLGSVQGKVLSDGYANGLGGDLVPKGWPASPGDGAYNPRNRCENGGDLSPCSPPFDSTCANGTNGECVLASNWVMPACANDVRGTFTHTFDYAWSAVAQNPCVVDDGAVKALGGLILEVPTNAKGTYLIALDPGTSQFPESFMSAGDGAPIPDVVLTPACITVPTGSCCYDIGFNPQCEENLTEQECNQRPAPRFWSAGTTCGECGCPGDCGFHGPEFCDDFDPCTTDVCDFVCGHCQYSLSYDQATECCDPDTGDLEMISDGIACTIDVCDAATGNVIHNPGPSCFVDPDAHPKNRYLSFDTGVLPVASAFHVRMTASAHFPGSVGDLGWVGTPDSEGTALVVSDPVFLPSWPATMHAGDCEIVPVATYEIRASSDGVNFDSPIVIPTTASPAPRFWGDIVGDFNGFAWEPPNGVLNISDVQAAIKTWQADPSAPPLTWSDVEPEVPNRVVNLNDALRLILAFIGEPYPFADPADCP